MGQEQPLPKHSACNLGSINLSEFVKYPFTSTAYFDSSDFIHAVRIAVEALDTVLDENLENHALKEQKEMAYNYRNIGLGIMGMHDMLIKLGIKYGSKYSIEFMDSLMALMFKTAVIKSSELAKEKGTFPKYNKNLLSSKIIMNHFTDEELHMLEVDKYGLRNCSLLSIAPTGSLGTMLNISTGCEPLFALYYNRKTESLNNGQDKYYKVYTGVVNEYVKKYSDKLPDYFNSSSDIKWKDRIDMQSVLQSHVDTAISSTVNLPNNISVEDIEKLYLYAWEKGLKGVTIFRDGCKRVGILTTKDETNKKDQNEEDSYSVENLPRGYIIKTSDDMPSFSKNIINGCGDFTIHLDFDDYSETPYQSWISIGDGGCERNLDFISRLISLCLRGGIPLSEIIRQAKKVRPCSSYVNRKNKKGDVSTGTSCPSAIGFALEKLQKQISTMGDYNYNMENAKTVNIKTKETTEIIKEKCPECGEELKHEGGCNVCTRCGWSKCD